MDARGTYRKGPAFTTMEQVIATASISRGPCERRGPYAVTTLLRQVVVATLRFHDNGLWLWVPAFAGTTGYSLEALTFEKRLRMRSERVSQTSR
jgi:hypothetical protein